MVIPHSGAQEWPEAAHVSAERKGPREEAQEEKSDAEVTEENGDDNMTLTRAQKKKYYKNKHKVHGVIKRNAKRRGHVIYGERALNAHFPTYLDRPTEDWDVFTSTPRRTARRVERKLDNKFGGNYFRVERAKHEGTYKVKSNVTDRGVADYSKRPENIPTKTVRGHKYVRLSWVKRQIGRTLRDPKSEYRWKKDREALQRIRIHEAEKQGRTTARPTHRRSRRTTWPKTTLHRYREFG